MESRQLTEPICKEKLLLCSKYGKCGFFGPKKLKFSLNLFIRFFYLLEKKLVQKMGEMCNVWAQNQHF